MMAIKAGDETYEIEGVLFAGTPACSIRKVGGRGLTTEEFDRLPQHERKALIGIIRRHIDAVALLADNRLVGSKR